MCKHRLLLSLYTGITWTDLKITDVWIPPLEILIQLIWGAAWAQEFLKTFPGYLNVQPGLRTSGIKGSVSMTFPFHEITK